MAATYTRRINLYINGKQVSADIVSIRKEMSKLVNEQARMTIGSKEYIRHTARIKELKTIIDNHNQDLSTTHKKWNAFQRMADAANRYFAVITAGIAAVAGMVATVKGTVEAFAEYDDKLVDVMKTTDLTKQQTIELNKELAKINTRTAQLDLLELARVAGKLGIRGKEDVLGFVRATDKIKVALSEDLGGDTEESVRQLGKLVDIFKLTKEHSVEDALLKIGSAMNALGASGTANEGYMLEFTKRVAGVAPTAGISIDKILGLATTLDELGQTSEVSGTAFNQVISNMFKNTAEYAHIAGMGLQEFTDLMNKDANEALIQLLIGAKGSSDGFGQLANSLSSLGMDGVRATTVLGVLAANIDKLRENQKFSNKEFIKGNSLLIEFNKKNSSAQAQLEKAFKRFKEIQVQLGEALTPIYANTVHKASTLLKIFGATVEFLFKYGSTIVTVTGFLVAYAAAAKIAAMWEARKNIQMALNVKLMKTQTLLAPMLNAINIAAMKLEILFMRKRTAAQVAHVEMLKKQIMYSKMFGLSFTLNPIMLAITAVAALVTAVKLYDKYSAASIAREKEKTRALHDLKMLTEGYADNLDNLNKSIAESNTLTLEQKRLRKEETEELIDYLEFEIKRQELAQNALQQKFTEATLWQKTINMFKSGLNPYLANSFNIIDASKNGQEAAASMTDGINELKNMLIQTKGAAKDFNDILYAESQGDKIGTESLVMMNEKLAKYRIALENAVHGGKDYLRIQEKIQAVEAKMNKPKWNSDDQIAKEIEILEAAFNKKQAIIRQNFLQGKMTEDEYNDQMLQSELKFLADKLKIYNAGTKEYQEAVNKALELQVAVDIKLRDLQLKAEQELAAAKIENFRDEFARQEQEEINRWADEKTALEKRLIDKVTLSEKEQAINDAINATIEEKEKLHQQKMRDLKAGKNIADLENMVNATTPFDKEFAPLEEMQASFNARAALVNAQYLSELDLAANNHAAMLAAEKKYNDAMLQLKLDMIDAEWMQREQRIEAAQSFVTALSGIVDQETALGKALFAFNQGLAIAEIWMNVAKANAKALSLAPVTGGQPFVAINTAVGAAQTAMVLAQTLESFSGPKSETKDTPVVGSIAYSEGGFTPPGDKNDPAGIVHKSEYVISKEMLKNPQVKYIADIFEKMRTRRISLSQAAMPVLSSGGFTTQQRAYTPPSFPETNQQKTENAQNQDDIHAELAKAIKLFMSYRPTVAVETIEREREKYIQIKQTKGL